MEMELITQERNGGSRLVHSSDRAVINREFNKAWRRRVDTRVYVGNDPHPLAEIYQNHGQHEEFRYDQWIWYSGLDVVGISVQTSQAAAEQVKS